MVSFELLFNDSCLANYGYAEVRLFKRIDYEFHSLSYLVIYSGTKKRYFHRSKLFDSYDDAFSSYNHYCSLVHKL